MVRQIQPRLRLNSSIQAPPLPRNPLAIRSAASTLAHKRYTFPLRQSPTAPRLLQSNAAPLIPPSPPPQITPESPREICAQAAYPSFAKLKPSPPVPPHGESLPANPPPCSKS